MEHTKTSIDIRLILEQLNIPIEKYEQWNRADAAVNHDSPSISYPEAWNSAELTLRRQEA